MSKLNYKGKSQGEMRGRAYYKAEHEKTFRYKAFNYRFDPFASGFKVYWESLSNGSSCTSIGCALIISCISEIFRPWCQVQCQDTYLGMHQIMKNAKVYPEQNELAYG